MRDEADGSLGVAGRVENVETHLAETDDAALGELGRGDAGWDRERGEERLRVQEALPVGRVGGDLGAAGRIGAVGAAIRGDDGEPVVRGVGIE